MPVRLKKLVGTILLVALVIVYAIAATLVAVARLGDASWPVQFAYFLLTAFLWVLPAMAIIKWMLTPPRNRKVRI